ncbi:MAG TPA: hypothetical protein VJ831_14955 [Jatrophihabitantaceae bacterium]|nr:hypothetical protein [Jatrophihabitantaceae bacterium]
MTDSTEGLQRVVASSADTADMHATVPTLLLELQTLLGSLTATVNGTTERGRRPFRPTPDWPTRVGELAYGVYLLADQSGVEVDEVVRQTAQQLLQRGRQAHAADGDWPFKSH